MKKIAIFTDPHGLLEPVEAVLEDMRSRGITEIYSLGDNIGVGPNPREVLSLIQNSGVISVAGNSEEYIRLGIAPFKVYFSAAKTKSQMWTASQLTNEQKEWIKSLPCYLELVLKDKKIALCHFANDVRFDYLENGTYAYQNKVAMGSGYQQFYVTNSFDQIKMLKYMVQKYGNYPEMMGMISALSSPLFGGKSVSSYDAVFQGHVHFKIMEENEFQQFYSIRAVGMAYQDNPSDNMASYIILTENENGYELEEVLVPFDREKMIYSIIHSSIPDRTIERFVVMNNDDFARSRRKKS